MAAISAALPATSAADTKAAEDEARKGQEEAALARVSQSLRAGSALTVALHEGELRFLADGAPVARAYVSADHAALVQVQWELVAHTFEPGGRDDGKRLIERLRAVVLDAPPEIAAQIMERAAELGTISTTIAGDETALNDMTCSLFDLTPDERALVARGR